jgi:hypothetical protein
MPVYNAHKQPMVDLSEGESNLFLLSTPCLNVLKSG